MKRYLLILMFLPALVLSQTKVTGVVLQQNSGKSPLPGVQIVAHESQSDVSDNNGKFQLFFKKKQPGDRVIVADISKKGFEVVNKSDIENWIISNSIIPKVVMCPEGKIAENTALYYNVSLAALTKTYNDSITLLKKELEESRLSFKSYADRISFLSKKFIHQQGQLEALAERFAHENFDDCSEIHKKAFNVFISGNIKDAIGVLESVNSENEIAKAREQIKRGDDLELKGKDMKTEAYGIIETNIHKLLFQADLYNNDLQYSKADSCYITAINADTTNFKSLYEYCIFLKQQNKYNQEITYLKKAKKIAKTNKQLAVVYNEIGQIELLQNNYKESEQYLKSAILICQKTPAEEQPLIYEVYSSILQAYSNYFKLIKNDLDSALFYCKLSEELYLKMPKEKSFDYNYGLALIKSFQSQIYSKKNEKDTAIQLLNEAIHLNEGYQDSICLNNARLAIIYNEKAFYYLGINQLDSSEVYYNKSIGIYEKLARKNPEAFNPDLALMLYNKGILNFYKNNLNLSGECFFESIKIRKKLADDDPLTYTLYLTETINNLGYIYQVQNKLDESEKLFLNAINILTPQLDFHISYKIENARMYQNLGDTYFKHLKNDLAYDTYKKVLNLYNELTTKYHENLNELNDYRIKSYRNLAYLMILNKQFNEAEQIAKEGLTNYTDSIQIKSFLAHAELYQGKYKDAVKIYKEIATTKKIREQLLADIEEFQKLGITAQKISKITKLLNRN